ncbi:MAG: NUDIX hydrolase [Oscillospiraceae bacterium]|nr:NUDIX hydrolase [Oscillospiraceae bacterium]
MAHTEKTLAVKELYNGKVVRLTLDTVELENGNTSYREIVHHRGGACIAALTPQNEIYLVRQFRYALGQELWELPAGKLEAGEDPFEAAQRELEEECGLQAEEYIDLHPFYPTVGYCSEVIYTWLARGLHPVPMHPDEDEFVTPEKFPLEDVYRMILDGKIRDGKTVAAVLKIKALLAEGRL